MNNITWFLRRQTSGKKCQWKKSRLSLFILDNRKWRPFHLKDDNVKIWVEVIIVTFLYPVATLDVLMANSNDVNLAKTRYVHFAWSWNRRPVLIEWTNSAAITGIGKFYHMFAPWNTTWQLFNNIPSILERVQIWRVSWMMFIPYWSHSPPRRKANTSYLISHGLGVTIDGKLAFSEHTSAACKRASSRARV